MRFVAFFILYCEAGFWKPLAWLTPWKPSTVNPICAAKGSRTIIPGHKDLAMAPLNYLWVYLIAVMVFLGIDAVWFKTMTPTLLCTAHWTIYQWITRHDRSRRVLSILCFALCVVVIYPQQSSRIIGKNGRIWGGIGLMAYGTYDFTSLALLKGYDDKTAALVDFIWGGLVTGLTCVIVGVIYKTGWWISKARYEATTLIQAKVQF